MDENNRIILRTYRKAWDFEKKLYSIGDVSLPQPIVINYIMYYFVGFLIAWFLAKIMPFLVFMPPVIWYFGLPGLFVFMAVKVKFDDKPTLIWIRGFLKYLFIEERHAERFMRVPRNNKYKFTGLLRRGK